MLNAGTMNTKPMGKSNGVTCLTKDGGDKGGVLLRKRKAAKPKLALAELDNINRE